LNWVIGWRGDDREPVDWADNMIFIASSFGCIIVFHLLITFISKRKANFYFRIESGRKEKKIERENKRKVMLLKEDNEVTP